MFHPDRGHRLLDRFEEGRTHLELVLAGLGGRAGVEEINGENLLPSVSIIHRHPNAQTMASLIPHLSVVYPPALHRSFGDTDHECSGANPLYPIPSHHHTRLHQTIKTHHLD